MSSDPVPSTPNDDPSWGDDLPEIENTTTYLRLLQGRGAVIPAPETLADAAIAAALKQLIVAMADARIFLINTNHLSDRELYSKLYHEALRNLFMPSPDPTVSDVIDLVDSSIEANMQLYHRYYADDDERAEWQSSYPDYVMPPREQPPFQRDAGLPKSPEMDDEN